MRSSPSSPRNGGLTATSVVIPQGDVSGVIRHQNVYQSLPYYPYYQYVLTPYTSYTTLSATLRARNDLTIANYFRSTSAQSRPQSSYFSSDYGSVTLGTVDANKDYVSISANTGDGVERLSQAIRDRLPEGEALYPADYLTDQPERFFAAEMVREKLLQFTHAEIPFSSAVVVDRFEEPQGPKDLLRIHCTIIVDRESQKPIVVYIDDLQWSDKDSGRLLVELLSPPERPPFLLVTTFRREEVATSPALAALTHPDLRDRIRDLHVGPLSFEGSCDLARRLFAAADPPPSDEVVAAIARESDGNPFFVGELVRHVSAGGAVEVSLSEVVAGTLNQLTVDGDMSTNDAVVMMANGAADNFSFVLLDVLTD